MSTTLETDTTSQRTKLSDGWAEGPLAHGKFATASAKENEYFMQWIHPMKYHRMALKTAVGWRCTHGLADDVINDDIGVKIPDEPEMTTEINKKLKSHLKRLNWIKEMRKFAGNLYEQGESITLNYYKEPVDDSCLYLETEIPENAEIIGCESFSYMDYKIIEWDGFGEPVFYNINLRNAFSKGTHAVRVHRSRVMRFTDKELDERETGYPLLGVIYDCIIVLSNIIKASGEAAFRWGTGHPLILTKNIMEDDEVLHIQKIIGNPTRRSWHILPREFIDEFKLIGQAGEMLNLGALAELVMKQIIIATKIPAGVFYGEIQVATGEIEDKSYYGLLYEKHVQLDPFVRLFFERDINIRKLLYPFPDYEIDWGIRQVLNKMDETELRQRTISNALAMSTFCTFNECRKEIGMPPLEGEEGEIILGLMPYYAAADEANDEKEKNKSTKDQAARGKDLEKDKSITGVNKLRENKKAVRDSLENMRRDHSVDKICELMGISKPTYYKIEKWSEEDA